MNTLVIIIVANIIVGCSIGICGIAGFLLPMLYSGFLGYSVEYALAFSFLAFLVSGIIGSYNYYLSGNLELTKSIKISLGSIIGAIIGVYLQSLISQEAAKAILYLVVLVSGISILYRLRQEANLKSSLNEESTPFSIVENDIFLVSLGLLTAIVCSLSGAGGPILVMPLLVTLGISPRLAVGISLLNSVFIAVPACIGYLGRISWQKELLLLIFIAIAHGIGVMAGSRMANIVPVRLLKLLVAIFSIIIATLMLSRLFI